MHDLHPRLEAGWYVSRGQGWWRPSLPMQNLLRALRSFRREKQPKAVLFIRSIGKAHVLQAESRAIIMVCPPALRQPSLPWVVGARWVVVFGWTRCLGIVGNITEMNWFVTTTRRKGSHGWWHYWRGKCIYNIYILMCLSLPILEYIYVLTVEVFV